MWSRINRFAVSTSKEYDSIDIYFNKSKIHTFLHPPRATPRRALQIVDSSVFNLNLRRSLLVIIGHGLVNRGKELTKGLHLSVVVGRGSEEVGLGQEGGVGGKSGPRGTGEDRRAAEPGSGEVDVEPEVAWQREPDVHGAEEAHRRLDRQGARFCRSWDRGE